MSTTPGPTEAHFPGTQCECGSPEASRIPTHGDPAPGLVGRSRALASIKEKIRTAARVACPVLIHGPSGTGKEMLARAIHEASSRRPQPFVPVNCAALPADLVESELFGCARGAFTGAHVGRIGLFAAADGGTLFLDEIGEMAPVAQVKLLRALQEHAIRPVGESRERSVDVRVLAATNRSVVKAVEDGLLRPDLYFRLAVLTIGVAPLRERPEDIEPIADDLLAARHRERGEGPLRLSPEALVRLREHPWPGNVRELQNVLESAILMAGTAAELGVECLMLPRGTIAAAPTQGGAPRIDDPPCLRAAKPVTLRDGEVCLIRRALDTAEGNKAQAARLLGISRPLLYKRMKKLGITPAPTGAIKA